MVNNTWITTTPQYLTTSYFFSALVALGLISAFWERHKFMLSLLSLEFVLLGLFGGLMLTLSKTSMPMAIGLFLLVLGACEATLGLSLLINITRQMGSDLLKQTSITKC